MQFVLMGLYVLSQINHENSKDKKAMNYEDYEDYEDECYSACPKCGRSYDEIDYEYQICKACGWDAEKNTFSEKIEPTAQDYMNGDADILTGQWY